MFRVDCIRQKKGLKTKAKELYPQFRKIQQYLTTIAAQINRDVIPMNIKTKERVLSAKIAIDKVVGKLEFDCAEEDD